MKKNTRQQIVLPTHYCIIKTAEDTVEWSILFDDRLLSKSLSLFSISLSLSLSCRIRNKLSSSNIINDMNVHDICFM